MICANQLSTQAAMSCIPLNRTAVSVIVVSVLRPAFGLDFQNVVSILPVAGIINKATLMK